MNKGIFFVSVATLFLSIFSCAKSSFKEKEATTIKDNIVIKKDTTGIAADKNKLVGKYKYISMRYSPGVPVPWFDIPAEKQIFMTLNNNGSIVFSSQNGTSIAPIYPPFYHSSLKQYEIVDTSFSYSPKNIRVLYLKSNLISFKQYKVIGDTLLLDGFCIEGCTDRFVRTK